MDQWRQVRTNGDTHHSVSLALTPVTNFPFIFLGLCTIPHSSPAPLIPMLLVFW